MLDSGGYERPHHGHWDGFFCDFRWRVGHFLSPETQHMLRTDDDEGDDDDDDDDHDDHDDGWLVVWNHGFFADFPFIGNVIIPFFSEGRYTTNQFITFWVVMMIIPLLSFNVESYNRSNDVDHRKISHRQFIMSLNDNTVHNDGSPWRQWGAYICHHWCWRQWPIQLGDCIIRGARRYGWWWVKEGQPKWTWVSILMVRSVRSHFHCLQPQNFGCLKHFMFWDQKQLSSLAAGMMVKEFIPCRTLQVCELSQSYIWMRVSFVAVWFSRHSDIFYIDDG